MCCTLVTCTVMYCLQGFFMDKEFVSWNPGAGTMCEGEDWLEINKLQNMDVSIVHVYDRQMESIPPKWNRWVQFWGALFIVVSC